MDNVDPKVKWRISSFCAKETMLGQYRFTCKVANLLEILSLFPEKYSTEWARTLEVLQRESTCKP